MPQIDRKVNKTLVCSIQTKGDILIQKRNSLSFFLLCNYCGDLFALY
jgi:hypothetical protein